MFMIFRLLFSDFPEFVRNFPSPNIYRTGPDFLFKQKDKALRTFYHIIHIAT